MIRKLFSPPVFDKEEDNFRARFINGFAWIAVFILLVSLFIGGIDLKFNTTELILLGLIGVQVTSLYLLRNGQISTSGIIIVIFGWVGLTYLAYSSDGVKDVVVIAYIAISLLASIVANLRVGLIVSAVSVLAIYALAYFELSGFIIPSTSESLDYARDLSLIFVIITALNYFGVTSLNDAVTRANTSEADLRKTNDELQRLNQTLGERVASRTSELELANARNEKRAEQFEAVTQVARATTTNEKLDTLLPRLASLVSKNFGFYHTGIFLLDPNREYAVLRAANSEGGKRMLERGHKLPIGQTGIVGFVSATGTPRIVLDVGDDAVFFDNPDLPNTHSEMALPLRISGEIIGVLDVQSTRANEFQEDDIEVLSTLADQVAVAIHNARTYQTMQELLEKVQTESGAYIRESWRVLQSEETISGYRASGNEIVSLVSPLRSNRVENAVNNNQIVLEEDGDNATLAIPIRLRNDIVGVIDVHRPTGHPWDEDEIDIVEAVADRLSLALESSILLKSTQRQAELERITTEISGKIGATTQFDSILRTAAEELSRVLGGSEVLVQIQSLETSKDTDE